jgi:EpsI family protein
MKLDKKLMALTTLIAASWIYCFHGALNTLLSRWKSEDYSYCYLVPVLFVFLMYQVRGQLTTVHRRDAESAKKTKIQQNQRGSQDLEIAISVNAVDPVLQGFSPRPLRLCGERLDKAWPGFCLLILSAVLNLVGNLGSIETVVYFSLWLSVCSIVSILFGPGSLRVAGFPLLILLFAIPAPAFIGRVLTFDLRLFSSEVAARLIRLAGFSALREGNIIDLGQVQFQVADACSGLRYLFPAILMALLIGYFFNRSFWQRATIAILAVPVAIFVNILRLLILAVLVFTVSPVFAEEGFLHDLSGWAIFLVITGTLFGVSWLFRNLGQRPIQGFRNLGIEGLRTKTNLGIEDKNQFRDLGETEFRNLGIEGLRDSRTNYSIPQSSSSSIDLGNSSIPQFLNSSISLWVRALCIVAVLLALHFTAGRLVTGQEAPSRKTFADFPMQIDGWEGQREYLPQDVLDNLWADDYVAATFRKSDNGLTLLISYYFAQTSYHTAHAPTSCLLGSGWGIKAREVLSANIENGRKFPVHQLLLEKDGHELLSNFWFQERGRIITGEFDNKLCLLWDALTRRRTDGALVRVEMIVQPGQSVDQAQNAMDGFTVGLKKILGPYVPE